MFVPTEQEQPPTILEMASWSPASGPCPHRTIDTAASLRIAPHTSGAYVLLPVNIQEVISDQIAGNDANKLPTAYFGGNPAKPENGHPNNPMLMATRTGQKAKLRVKMSTTNLEIYVGARKITTQTILGSASCASSPVALEFDVPATSHNIYEVVAGYDANGNSKLDDDEAKAVFEKTPRKDKEGNTATANLNLIDKIIIVDQRQFTASRVNILDLDLFGSEYTGDLIVAFARGSVSVPNATTTNQVPIASTQPGLSHPVGAKWNASNQDSTYRFTFADGSPASNDTETSNALKEIVQKVINDHKTDMISAYTDSPEWPVSPYYNFSEDKNFVTTDPDPIGISELGYAFGKVTIKGKLRISYKKTGAATIQVGSVEVVGTFDDLYDFQYQEDENPKQASMVQAGHATLASSLEPNGGKVFYTRVEFNTNGFVNTWNGSY